MSDSLCILAYHSIADDRDDRVLHSFSVPADVFARQLDTLLRAGYHFIDGNRLERFLDGREVLPTRSALITFDDCYTDLLDVALPILEERDIPALAFAVAGQVGGTNDWDVAAGSTGKALLGPAGLASVAARGVEIGAHGHTHRLLTEVPSSELEMEITGALDTLAAFGVPRPRYFSYPYGGCNHAVFQAIASAGVAAAFSVKPALVTRRDSRYLLPRFVVFREDADWRLRWKLASHRFEEKLTQPAHRFPALRRGMARVVRRTRSVLANRKHGTGLDSRS